MLNIAILATQRRLELVRVFMQALHALAASTCVR
jgi:hypothetical protein